MAQNWELSGGAGYGVYHNATISGAAGTATAGIRNQYAVTAAAGEDLFEHFSGEVRFVYQPGDTFLESGAAKGSIAAYSYTFTYDALLHLMPRASRIRPYAAFGAGAKYFSVTGTIPKPQPAPAIAGLTTQSQWEPAFDFGAGVKFRVTEHLLLNGYVRDYIALYPDHLFSPVGKASTSSVLQQVTPMFEIAYRF
jgi:opacity protein-like surface antigen